MHTNNATRAPESALVLLDHHHVLASAATTHLHFGARPDQVDLDPGRLGRRIADTRRRPTGHVDVAVFRGIPPWSTRDHIRVRDEIRMHEASTAAHVEYVTADYSYDDAGRPREKEIDQLLGFRLEDAARDHEYDAVILFGCDRDLAPSIRRAVEVYGCHLELAQWSGHATDPHPLAGALRSPWWHNLGPDDLAACARIRPGLYAA